MHYYNVLLRVFESYSDSKLEKKRLLEVEISAAND